MYLLGDWFFKGENVLLKNAMLMFQPIAKQIFHIIVNVTECRCMWDSTCVQVLYRHAMAGFSGLSAGGGAGFTAAAADFLTRL